MNSSDESNEQNTENGLLKPSLDDRADGSITLSNNDIRNETKPDENDEASLQEPHLPLGYETSFQRRQRRKSHHVIYATTFIMSIGFSIILTGVWPYLKELDPSSSKEFLGWVIAINPFGQMIASPLLGWWGSKSGSNRCAFIITVVMFIVGNVLYAILPLFQSSAKYIMLLSRFIIGISSANIAVCRSYISCSTKQSERTFGLSITAAAQSMGFILGPSIQTALTYVYPMRSKSMNLMQNGTSDIVDDQDDYLSVFNMYSLAGWFTAILGFLNFFLLLPCVYQESNIAASEEQNIRLSNNNEEGVFERKTDYLAISIILFGYFSVLILFVIIETLVVPMCLDLYAWTPEFTVQVVGIGLTVTGVIAFFMFIFSGKIAKVFNDRKVFICLGLIPLAFSLALFFPVGGETPKIKDCSLHNLDTSDGVNDTKVINQTLSLSRSRRATIIESEDCDALGCPSSQDWCYYTPIIHIPQLIVAASFMAIGYPVGISLSGAIFSKLLKAKKQGLWMGILTSTGSFSRFVGPVFVSYLYTAKGPLWTFGSLFCLIIFVLILNLIFYKRFAPISYQRVTPTA